MYRAVITDLGEAWLATTGVTPTHRALAALVSPQVEAADPRALFDAFCVRINERFGIPQDIDQCRVLWREMCGDELIAVRGSSLTDAGLAFAMKDPPAEGARPRWGGKRNGDMPASRNTEAPISGQPPPVSPAPNPLEVPLIPRRVSNMFRGAVGRIVRGRSRSVAARAAMSPQTGYVPSPNGPAATSPFL